MNIYLLSFNNYYNRIVKRYEDLTSYSGYNLASRENVNFNPNDGVDTELILNYDDNLKPDYLIAADNDEIVSRWFIMDAVRIRSKQYRLKLHRDVIADHYDSVVSAPIFIEKATLNSGDPLIYNSENFGVNQIKNGETLLKDSSGCSWIVGYLATKQEDVDNTLTASLNIPSYADITVLNIREWEWYAYSQESSYCIYANGKPRVYFYSNYTTQVRTGFYELSKSRPSWKYIDVAKLMNYVSFPDDAKLEILNQAYINSGVNDSLPNLVPGYMPSNLVFGTDRLGIINLNGKTIKDENENKFYRIAVNMTDVTEEVKIGVGDLHNNLIGVVRSANENAGYSFITGQANPDTFTVNLRYFKYDIVLTETVAAYGEVTLPSERYSTSDGTYDMFCMPYADVEIYEGNTRKYIQDANVSLAAAIGLARKYYGANQIYDLQLVPFCPAPYILDDEGKIDIGNHTTGSIRYNENEIGTVIFPTNTKFSFDIGFSVPEIEDAVEKKVALQCDTYRICSPNYNGVFEFNPQKNGGVAYINVDVTYKPYSPYIHLNPNFGELYGRDFDDSRGLICGGDFSLPINTDAWSTYELQNKNYQRAFDRQIEHIEYNNNMQMVGDIANAVVGTIGGAVGGAGASSISGAGMGVGAAVGGALSAAAGVADVLLNQQIRSEALDFTKDNFGYQLGNIQALPYSLARTTAYTNNNKIFPFIEYYTCTDREKDAFRNKLKYNGMTVMAIGTMSEYIKLSETYIKGRLIRLDNVAEDYHVATAIADELNKGVFI